MKKKRGHFCHVCQRCLPNEAFSGKGHARHLCKECARMPKEEREAIEQADEIYGFLDQSHISDLNVKRLEALAQSPNPETAELAGIVLEAARVKPYKKRRLQVLAQKRPELLARLHETGLIEAHQW